MYLQFTNFKVNLSVRNLKCRAKKLFRKIKIKILNVVVSIGDLAEQKLELLLEK